MSESQVERQKITTEAKSVNAKVNKGVGARGGAPGRADILLQPVEESTEEMIFPCGPQMRDT